MSIEMKCPRCGKRCRFRDGSIGMDGRCGHCRARFTISVPITSPRQRAPQPPEPCETDILSDEECPLTLPEPEQLSEDKCNPILSLRVQGLLATRLVLEFVATDSIWKAFGYKRHPKRRGKLAQMMNSKSLRLESLLTYELWSAAAAAVFVWAKCHDKFAYRVEFTASLFENCIDGVRPDEPFWPAYHFSDREDALEYLSYACHDYSTASETGNPYFSEATDKRIRVFLDRSRDRCDDEIPAEWAVGASILFVMYDPVTMVTLAFRNAGIAEIADSDLHVRDQRYLDLVAALFDGEVPYFPRRF
jgi:hypothetical protein